MFAVVLSVGRSVLYGVKRSNVTILEDGDLKGTVTPEDAGTILIWDTDSTGKDGRREMSAILSQMRIPFVEKKAAEFTQADLEGKDIAVLSVTDLSVMKGSLTSLLDWVIQGHSLLFLYPPYNEETFLSISSHLGITSVKNSLAKVEGLHFTKNIMPGSSRDLSIMDAYESSLDVTLDGSCEVFLEAAGASDTPLIWRRALGNGTLVFDNLSFLEKAYRGFHCAAYSLLQDDCVWPVINGSTFYIDDFPSPVPEGDRQFIPKDYGMDIKDFYTHHWWKDVYNLSKQYNIRYTGLVIEDYSAQVDGVFPRNKDIQRSHRKQGNIDPEAEALGGGNAHPEACIGPRAGAYADGIALGHVHAGLREHLLHQRGSKGRLLPGLRAHAFSDNSPVPGQSHGQDCRRSFYGKDERHQSLRRR